MASCIIGSRPPGSQHPSTNSLQGLQDQQPHCMEGNLCVVAVWMENNIRHQWISFVFSGCHTAQTLHLFLDFSKTTRFSSLHPRADQPTTVSCAATEGSFSFIQCVNSEPHTQWFIIHNLHMFHSETVILFFCYCCLFQHPQDIGPGLGEKEIKLDPVLSESVEKI